MILESICAFGLVGFSCEIGQRFTANFSEISDTIDKLNWYKFPIYVQRIWPTIIHVAQQELAIECFGSVLCVREAFKSVSITTILLQVLQSHQIMSFFVGDKHGILLFYGSSAIRFLKLFFRTIFHHTAELHV